MRKETRTLAAVTVLFFITASVYGLEAKRASSEDIISILAEFPTESSADMEELASEIMELGRDGIVDLCLMLESDEETNRTRAEYAVNGLAVSTARFLREDDRFLASKAFIKSLKFLKDKNTKGFILSQLQLIGKREAVKPIARYLTDRKLCEPAARALLSIGTERAEKAFIRSLDSVSGDRLVTVIKALGELRSQKAVKKISPYVSSQDRDLRRVSLYALANMGDPSCMDLMGKARLRSSAYERERAPLVYLLYVSRLAEAGYKEISMNICRDMIAAYTTEDESQVLCSALDLLVSTAGEGAMDDLLEAAESQSAELRRKALELSLGLYSAGMREKWIRKVEEVSPEVQAEILTMLGKTDDKSLAPFFRQKLHSESQIIRMAAVRPLCVVEREKAVPDLFGLLRSGKEEEVQLVKQAFLGFNAEAVIPEIKTRFKEMPVKARMALMGVISGKRAFNCVDLVASQIESKDEDLRRTALLCLESIVDEDNIPMLIDLLRQTDDKKEILLLQNALQSACGFIEAPEMRADKVISALAEADGEKKLLFLRPLSEIGGEKALNAVLEARRSKNPEVSLEAFSALVQWKGIEAEEELLAVSRETTDKKFRYLALRSYIRIATESELDGEQKLALMQRVKDITQEVEEKRLFLSGLGEIKTLSSMKEAAFFLQNEELREKAAGVMVKIALPEPLHNGLSGDEVLSLLEKALVFIEDEYQRERITDYIDDIRN
jgi:HEAT repeat protein